MKLVRKLLKSAKARSAERAFCVEGHKLITEAVAAGYELQTLYFVGELPKLDTQAELVEVSEDVMASVASTVSPQPQLGVFTLPNQQDNQLSDFVPVLVDVNDPGNLGAIARSSEGAGVSTLVVVGESVDSFNPKVIRSSAGSIFRIGITSYETLEEPVSKLKAAGYAVLATAVSSDNGVISHTEANLAKSAVVFGSEAHGLSREQVELCDGAMSIDTDGHLESLNLAASVAVIAFEAKRQRVKSS